MTRRQWLGSSVAAAVLPWQLISRPGASQTKTPGQTEQKRTGANEFGFPLIGISVESQAMLLAIDDHLLPFRKNLCLYLSRPKVRKEPVLVPSVGNQDSPDSMAVDFTGTVLFDKGKYRMWYLGSSRGPTQTEEKEIGIGPSKICYAESQDGIRWTKPSLGSRGNNAIAIPDPRTEGVALIHDPDDPNPERRYKLVYQRYNNSRHYRSRGYWTLGTATSPDGGDDWSFSSEFPIANFIEFGSFYKHDGLYIVNAQTVSPFWRGEGGTQVGRQGMAWVSADFDRWLQEGAESFFLPEPQKTEERGPHRPYDQVHLGTGAASFGNVLVGLYCIWRNRPQPGDWFGKGTTSGDFGLVVSNDGLHFREPVKGHVYLSGQESAATADESASYPTILVQGNGILNVGEETRIYHGRWLNKKSLDWYGEVALATLPRDRWGALGLFPDQAEGTVWSAPIVLPEGGCEMALNADDAAGMRVEISDDRFNLLPGYSGAESGVVMAKGGLEGPVTWSERNLSALADKKVRFRIHLKKRDDSSTPKLYAVYLKCQT